MSKSMRVLIACALGSLIGSIIAISQEWSIFALSIKWNILVGLPVGGFIGYMMYNFRDVPVIARQVWTTMDAKSRLLIVSLKDNSVYVLRRLGASIILVSEIVILISNIAVLLWGICWFMESPFAMQVHWGIKLVMSGIVMLLIFVGMFGGVALTASVVIWAFIEQDYAELKRVIGDVSKYAYWFNPIYTFVYWIPVALCRVLKMTVMLLIRLPSKIVTISARICGAIMAIGIFTKRLFIGIHSDERLLCMTDAVIGVTIGWYFQTAILGMIVGAVFGVLNYELISKRWLKLVPIRN
ncbi:MAG: hypothetical protein ABH884_03230 [Candidatus Komeilibacteria bacterium]